MSLTPEKLKQSFEELGLTVETDGTHYVHATAGRHAPLIQTVVTIDEDSSGATIIAALEPGVAEEKRGAVYELLNLVHGQSLWNVRLHLDDEGKVLSIGKVFLWGKPYNPVQFADVLFSLLVTVDRLYPCVQAITQNGKSPAEAFEQFFLQSAPSGETND